MSRIILFILLFLLPALGVADDGPGVYDQIKLLSAEQKNKLQSEIVALERQTTAELAVLIIDRLNGEGIDEYANRTFNSWGIGKKDFNNGILLLVAVGDRRARIEVGTGLEELISDSLAGEILDRQAVPYFRENQYAEGITNTVQEIIRNLKNNPEAARGVDGSTPWYLRNDRNRVANLFWIFGAFTLLFLIYAIYSRGKLYSRTVFFGFILTLLAVGGVAIYTASNIPGARSFSSYLYSGGFALMTFWYNLKKLRRNAPKKCKACRTTMLRLPEDQDDVDLNKYQQKEEQLKSVDYDVWHCPACLQNQVLGYNSIVSQYSKCPQCKAKTVKHQKSTVLVRATTSHAGKSLEDFTCLACAYKFQKEVRIPAISSSSGSSSSSGRSSGGSSFGGGSSSGGGASRGW